MKVNISEATRRDIFDYFKKEDISWSGRLDEADFLARIFQIDDLPSSDYRFNTAREDIIQHRKINFDWEDNWILFDERFNLLHCEGKIFLNFLLEILDPVVIPDTELIEKINQSLNVFLIRDGFQLVKVGIQSGRPKYKAVLATFTPRSNIPNPIITIVAQELASYYYSHKKIDRLFMLNGVPGEGPNYGVNCIERCTFWLKKINQIFNLDPLKTLGKILEEIMEVDGFEESQVEARNNINTILKRYGMTYQSGGKIFGGHVSIPSRSLSQILKDKDIPSIEEEFERALRNVEEDPKAAIASACSILESLFKIFLEGEKIDFPNRETIGNLWKKVQKKLGMQPSTVEDMDLKRILSGLTSVVDGIGSLRTHASSAHGSGGKVYRIHPRHARLTVHSAHTLTVFILETWDLHKEFEKGI